jgi:hypothetical protein
LLLEFCVGPNFVLHSIVPFFKASTKRQVEHSPRHPVVIASDRNDRVYVPK